MTRVLGPPRHRTLAQPEALPVGVATGLSVGAHGGAKMFVEVARIPGGKGELRLTGSLGEVMRESAHAALTRVRMVAMQYGLDDDALAADFHVHVPEAAVTKDGPSGGVALFAAFLSAVRGVPLPADVALTGELTLSGTVLAVGGIKAKLLAAERAGMARVLLPEDNRADVPETLERSLEVEVVFIRDLDQVVAALFDAPSARPVADGNASAEAPR